MSEIVVLEWIDGLERTMAIVRLADGRSSSWLINWLGDELFFGRLLVGRIVERKDGWFALYIDRISENSRGWTIAYTIGKSSTEKEARDVLVAGVLSLMAGSYPY